MNHGMKLNLTTLLATALFALFILVSIQEGVTDPVRFLLRDYFTATLAILVLFANTWLSWLNFREGLDYLEGFWRVDVHVKDWRGKEDRPVRGRGDMYLTRAGTRNSFHGYIKLEYVDRTGNSMFVATYEAKFRLKMKGRLSSIGNVDGRTIMVCRKPLGKEGHDSFVKEHKQTLAFDKKDLSLMGDTQIVGQEVIGEFKALKESP